MPSSPYPRLLLTLSAALSILTLLSLFLIIAAVKRAGPVVLSSFLERNATNR